MAAAGVERGENLGTEHEQADEDGDAHDGHQCLDRPGTDLHVRHAADDLKHENDERGAGDKCGGEKARCHQRGVPERPSTETAVKEGSDGVDRNRPRDTEKDEGNVPALVGCLTEETFV